MSGGWEYITVASADLAPDRLGELGGEGWELVAVEDGQAILKRRALSFREVVTNDQRRAVYAGTMRHTVPPRDLPLLNPALQHLLASTGHTDYFTVCDRGFPVPLGPERIDLALTDDLPTVPDVLRLVQNHFPIDRVVVPGELFDQAPQRAEELRAMLGEVPLHPMPHLDFKHLAQTSRATVRTGDATPYGNIIVVGG